MKQSKKSKENGKKYNLPRLIELIKSGERQESDYPADIIKAMHKYNVAAAKEAAWEKSPNRKIQIHGKIKSETDKAILFVAFYEVDDIAQEFIGKAWLPKSQVEFRYEYFGQDDVVWIPAWLIEKKNEAAQAA